MFRRLTLPFLLLVNLALAHSGYTQLVKDAGWAGHPLTVLEDTHWQNGQVILRLFIKLEGVEDSAPELGLSLEQEGISHTLSKLGLSTDDGKTFYQAYWLEFPLSQTGEVQAELTASTFPEPYHFSFRAAPKAGLSWLEFLPSLLIILIFVAGFALLYFSKDQSQHSPSFKKGLA
ncbi:MAG: hypothetical protein KC422_04485 [Trueperaceae bacterium]|nr:hypothetical protein [Trueperaceae bacterium]